MTVLRFSLHIQDCFYFSIYNNGYSMDSGVHRKHTRPILNLYSYNVKDTVKKRIIGRTLANLVFSRKTTAISRVFLKIS